VKLSLRWLSRYVDLEDLSPEQVRDDITMSTAEIEDIEVFGGELGDLVIGHVVEHGKHPNADKLSLNVVDVGDGEPLSIVCGAPNVAAGQNVAVITPGGVLPGGHKIKKTKIRGVESFGMICSERELGLSEDHEGIMVLGDDLRPGAKLVDALPIADTVLEIENKSINHRPDLWGHFGFARELSAILGRPLRAPAVLDAYPEQGRSLPIDIEDREDCARFTGVILEGVRSMPAPDWMRWQNQALCPDPWTSWVNRGTVKQLKALFGPRSAVLLDHVELSDEGQDFSLIGVGGVPATRITPTGEEKTFGAAADLTFEERKAIWTRWIGLYRKLMLSRGEYLNLYDLVYDAPETHVIRKGATLYYAFYPGEPDGIVADDRELYSQRKDTKHFQGRLELRGLDPTKSYRVHDYENDVDLGVVTGADPFLEAEIEHHLLVEVFEVE